MSDQGFRIVVEVCNHAEVDRLRSEMQKMDEEHRKEIARLERRLEGLHGTFYEFLERMSRSKNKG